MDRLPTGDPTEGSARVINLMTLDKTDFDAVVEEIAEDHFPKPAGEDLETTKDRVLDILEKNPKIRIHYKDDGSIDRVELNARGEPAGDEVVHLARDLVGGQRGQVREGLEELIFFCNDGYTRLSNANKQQMHRGEPRRRGDVEARPEACPNSTNV